MTDPRLNPVFPEPPGDALRLAFRKHVATTGQPETFADVSTAHPPKEGTVVVVEHPVDINRRTRSDRGMAPCPICSPDHGKYLNGGSLIWCEATQAIYAIGPDCYKHLWADGRMDKAINVFNEDARAKKIGIRLYHDILRIPRAQAWITSNRTLASRAETTHSSFGREMRRLRQVLSRSLKASDGVASIRGPLADIPIGRVAGLPFLTGNWPLGSEMDAAAAKLRAYPSFQGDDLIEWIDGQLPSRRAEMVKEIETAIETLQRVEKRIVTAASFMSKDNVRILGQWGQDENAPLRFSIASTATTVTFRCGESVWHGPAVIGLAKGSVKPIAGWSLQDAA